MDHVEPRGSYVAKALYYEDADALEYVRTDVPHIYRRVDEFLTLIFDFDSRDVVGFKIKGFRHFYAKSLQPNLGSHAEFPRLVTVLEQLMTRLGDGIFDETPRHKAYTTAADIARRDQVVVSDLPSAA